MNDQLIPREEEEEKSSKFIRFLSEPLSKYGWPTWLVYALAVIGIIYILNPTSGFLELIPDNLPLIGNIDEGAAVMLILAGIVEALEGRKYVKGKKEQAVSKTDTSVAESDQSG
ncbi:MAG: DUF1232 domain-containing protein [Chloroflexota bacterium]|nr:DUF1232 domain-containing protein [Chloroflexota bacterium]